jgi:hypothetical protein
MLHSIRLCFYRQLSMFYHFEVVLLFRPFLNLTFVGSSVSPLIIYIQAVESISSSVQSDHRLYTLRRTPSFVPYMVLTSDLALLIAEGINRHGLRMIRSREEDTQWAQSSEQLAVSHPFARDSADIIRRFAKIWQFPRLRLSLTITTLPTP